MALKEAVRKAIYLNNLYSYFNNSLNLGYKIPIPIILIDNQSAIKLANNPKFYKRSKHIDLIYYFTRQVIADNKVNILYIPTKEQIADFLTQHLPNLQQKCLIKEANIYYSPGSPQQTAL